MERYPDRPIFVGSSPSSGSTLLATLLNNHPQIACGPEMLIYNKPAVYSMDWARFQKEFPRLLRFGLPTNGAFLGAPFFQWLDFHGLSHPDLVELARQQGSLREFFTAFQDHVLEVKGKAYFAEKTPSNVYCFRQLVELFPDCRVVHIYRDGRDSLLSMSKRKFNFFKAASMWLYDTAMGLGMKDSPNYIGVRYEDLASDPEGTLRSLCDRLEIDYSPEMMEYKQDPVYDRQGKRGTDAWKNTPSGAISTTSTAKYKKKSPEEFKYFFEVQLNARGVSHTHTPPWTVLELMRELGYDDISLPEGDYRAQARKDLRDYILSHNNYFKPTPLLGRYPIWRPITKLGPHAKG